MINTLEAMLGLIQDTGLAGQELIQLAIPESNHCAFAIRTRYDQNLEAWTLMRSRLEQTGRYPVLVYSWLSNQNWEREVTENDFFSRFYYQEERFQGQSQNTAPEAILARVPQADLATYLANWQAFEADNLDARVGDALAQTAARFGRSPTHSHMQALIQAGTITSLMELEQWLFDWEVQNFKEQQTATPEDLRYLEWFEPRSSKVLILLPTMHSWGALAYLHWYAACQATSEVAIAFLQRWHQHYGAELVGHYGTMLQLQVAQPPPTPTAAFALAWEQYALAPYTLQGPGVSIRSHARSLLSTNQWFLHERP
ncbi:MAG: DUF4253 domain-containing protein [Leptolyngbyaceae cyanobacterium bins.349]|nr:DUF4253 domain-containing protein [Leptolyngbyaceae cyanobacterium bins.349]